MTYIGLIGNQLILKVKLIDYIILKFAKFKMRDFMAVAKEKNNDH